MVRPVWLGSRLESMTTSTSENVLRIRRRVSIPSNTGMETSKRTNWGCFSWMAESAAMPSPATPTRLALGQPRSTRERIIR
jgi:hypothetical protein